MNTYSSIAGNQTGIIKATALPLVDIDDGVNLRSITGTMPDYHKRIFKNTEVSIAYHVVGYGEFYEESLIRYTGESVERYSGMMSSHIYKNYIRHASYKELTDEGNKVMPLKYIDVFSQEQMNKYSKLIGDIPSISISEDDILGWVQCPSLFNKDQKIWVPAKMIFTGYETSIEKNEKSYIQSFSTGTASHKTFKQALLNAMVEYAQIDAFMLTWFCKLKCPEIEFDIPVVKEITGRIGGGEEKNFYTKSLYMSLPDMDLPVIGTFIIRNDDKVPYMLFGIQGDYDLKNAAVRSVMEGAAISYSSFFNTIFDVDSVRYAMGKDPTFLDLDGNVMYYGLPDQNENKLATVEDLCKGKIKLSEIKTIDNLDLDSQLKSMMKYLEKKSEYGVYLDITPPELREKGWHTARVFIPELLEMCLPDLPFKNHPRMKEFGGVINDNPHPMP